MKAKLLRMKTHLSTGDESGRGQTGRPASSAAASHDSLEEKLKAAGFEPFYFDGERSFRKRMMYADHSGIQRQMADMGAFWEENLYGHPLSFQGKNVDQLLFFDTETTGLSTGAGNMIFLIGYARVTPEGIEVTQHLLDSPSSEAAFLSGFLDDFSDEDYLVSYNGKAFDWPQVKSRHSFIRKQLPKLPESGHIDLLHCARRLWKHELPSCRLAVVEEHKLNLKRVNDIPGSMAPLLYYDFLQDKEPAHLEGIMAHNDQDVRSLVHLYLKICRQIMDKGEHLTVSEHMAVADWYEKLSYYNEALLHYHEAARKLQKPFPQVYYRLGCLYKKLRQKHDAIHYLEMAINNGSFPPVEAFVERAKLAEHYEKNPLKAMKYTKEGMLHLKKSGQLHGKTKLKLATDLNDRLKRLETKQIN